MTIMSRFPQDSVRDDEQRTREERPGLGPSERRRTRTVRSDLQLPGKRLDGPVCKGKKGNEVTFVHENEPCDHSPTHLSAHPHGKLLN